jgi:hypothetical protein
MCFEYSDTLISQSADDGRATYPTSTQEAMQQVCLFVHAFTALFLSTRDLQLIDNFGNDGSKSKAKL